MEPITIMPNDGNDGDDGDTDKTDENGTINVPEPHQIYHISFYRNFTESFLIASDKYRQCILSINTQTGTDRAHIAHSSHSMVHRSRYFLYQVKPL